VFATTGTFEPVRTSKREGYDLLAETLDGFLSTTRGTRGGATEDLHAEQRIVLTTMEK
jgi:hypothetical protein